VILHAEYFPSIQWVSAMLHQPAVEIEQWENYQKQGLRNRCKILGAEGIITLSVPLTGGREQRTLMKDVQINNSTNWATGQLRAIKSCYAKAPFFDHYYEPIEKLLTQNHESLLDLNVSIIKMITRWLKWEGTLTLTETFKGAEKPAMAPVKPYIQVFHDRQPFQPGLSVLDAFFCIGGKQIYDL